MTPLAQLLIEIMDIESVSGNEKELADWVEQRLSAFSHLTLHRDGDAIVARTDLGRAERVVIAGHLDTVPVAENLPAKLLHDDDDPDGDLVWGRGAVDMKGGVAVMLTLAEELSEPTRDITWIFYDNEEVESTKNGLGRLANNVPELIQGDFAILMEPTSALIEGGCQGTIRVDIETKGTAAHSARAWMGHNAIHDLAPILKVLAEYQPQDIEVDGLLYREGLNATGITGGMASNVIPPSASVHVNYRYAPDKSSVEALTKLQEWFDDYQLQVADVSPAARPGLDLPLAKEFVDAIGEAPRPKYGWTDVARFSELGIPAVNYGPGNPSLAHRDDEACRVSELDACAAGLRRWLNPERGDQA
ncbi:MAG TPA: succinyl-diaminopimelate desuccinylase [Tessaracoccus flavescens]|uniref:Succinyl-diaminopimelate desuccinylase n=1 Tax=Tessaracoccus flavescens TaxID=399497 RepID=A0A921JS74_9ACTN|nr:succinyl-diaminopimelate desuccinylase [Tessaracoccus flavescens]